MVSGCTVLLAVLIFVIVTISESAGPNKSNATAPPRVVTTPSVHISPVSPSPIHHHESRPSSEKSGVEKESWYGEKMDSEGILGCKWPSDFETRFEFCANRSSVEIDPNDGTEFGVLDRNITLQVMEECASGPCSDSKLNRTELVEWAERRWHEINNIDQFSKCLKKNSEGMVNLCNGNSEVAQIVSGIAGLHLGLMDILTKAYDRVKEGENHTETCLSALSEALHFTGALYLQSRFYAKNTVLCWDVKKGDCTPACKEFAYVLTCLESACPVLASDLPKFTIWEWYYSGKQNARSVCGLETDKLKCHGDSSSAVNNATAPTLGSTIASKSKVIFNKVKEKYHEFTNTVETYTHLKFFQMLLIAGGCLAVFIGMVTLLCMWYHGLICQRRQRRTLRYAKLMPEERMGRRMDETKSLTTDCDDIE